MQLAKVAVAIIITAVLGALGSAHAQQGSSRSTGRVGPKAIDIAAITAAVESEIVKMEDASRRHWEFARTIDDHSHIGTMYNEIDVPTHKCYILGRFLGFDNLVTKLKPQYKPDFKTRTSDNAYEMRIMGTSMSNYVHAARRILSEPQEARAMTWNLDCAGKHGIPKAAASHQGAKPFFVLEHKGTTLRVLGDVESDFSTKLERALDMNPKVDTVALGSGGGVVSEAILAGILIRTRGLNTILWNGCYSACPLVFMAGLERTIWSPYPTVGFHQISFNGQAVPFDHEVYKVIYEYATAMGANAEFVIKAMWSAAPDSMNTLEGEYDQLCDGGVATWIQRLCGG